MKGSWVVKTVPIMSMIQQQEHPSEMNADKRGYCLNNFQFCDDYRQYDKLFAFICVHFRVVNADLSLNLRSGIVLYKRNNSVFYTQSQVTGAEKRPSSAANSSRTVSWNKDSFNVVVNTMVIIKGVPGHVPTLSRYRQS